MTKLRVGTRVEHTVRDGGITVPEHWRTESGTVVEVDDLGSIMRLDQPIPMKDGPPCEFVYVGVRHRILKGE